MLSLHPQVSPRLWVRECRRLTGWNQREGDILEIRNAGVQIDCILSQLIRAFKDDIQILPFRVNSNVAGVGSSDRPANVGNVREFAGGGIDAVCPESVTSVVCRVEEGIRAVKGKTMHGG